MRSGAQLLVVLLAAPLAWVACNGILGIEEPELRPNDAKDTGVAGETGAETSSCVPARWPEGPSGETPGDAGDVSFVTAVKSIDLKLDAKNPLGYDIDGWCTCPGPPSCVRVGGTAPICDELGGRDVSLNSQIVPVLLETPGFTAEELNAGLQRGAYGIITEVRGYNGGLDDQQVEVSLFLSSGSSTGDAGVAWDGGDKWDLDPNSLTSGDAAVPVSRYVDATAYVKNGVLVASRLNGWKLTLVFGAVSFEVDASQTAMSAKIVKRPGGGYALEDGLIVGRMPTKTLLQAIGPLPAPGGTTPLCKPGLVSTPVYNSVKNSVCNAADVSVNADRDKDGKATCDAISFGLRFNAEPALFGGRRARPSYDAGCPPGWTDECPK